MQLKVAEREPDEAPHWGRRIAWLVVIWMLSVGALTLVAFAIKVIMRLAGFAI